MILFSCVLFLSNCVIAEAAHDIFYEVHLYELIILQNMYEEDFEQVFAVDRLRNHPIFSQDFASRA